MPPKVVFTFGLPNHETDYLPVAGITGRSVDVTPNSACVTNELFIPLTTKEKFIADIV